MTMSEATAAAEGGSAVGVQVAAENPPVDGAAEDAVIGKWAEDTQEALVIAPDKLTAYLTYLRDRQGYDFLSSVTCVDYSAYGGKLRDGRGRTLRVGLSPVQHAEGRRPRRAACAQPENETVASATGVYPGANLQECEVYDLYGIARGAS